MMKLGLFILCTGGIVYIVIPLLLSKLISIAVMIIGYLIVKYSKTLNTH